MLRSQPRRHSWIGVLLAAFLVVLPAATAPMIAGAAPAAAASSSCANFEFIGVAGSGEFDNKPVGFNEGNLWMGATMKKLYDQVASQYAASHITITPKGIAYTATAVSLLTLTPVSLPAYKLSVDDGVSKLLAELNRCPSTQFILAGYSQGAQVINTAQLSMTPRILGRVHAKLLFGNPRLNAAESGEIVTNHAALVNNGVLTPTFGADSLDPPYIAQKSRSYCAQADVICQGAGVSQLNPPNNITYWHEQYPTWAFPKALAFLKQTDRFRAETITASLYHTCALDTAGKAWCWGVDANGEVGDGPADQANKYAPVAVAGGRAYTAISAGTAHTCALDTAGKAWCWGFDGLGQVGDGPASQGDKYAPVAVAGGRAFIAISAGNNHTCALDTAGKAWCWGEDTNGQVGDGPASQANKYAPVAAPGGRAFTAISAGSSHTCALDTAGKAWCWGFDGTGGVGDGPASQGDKYAMAAVAGGRVFIAISAGGSHTCALDTAGKAWCWGDDAWGEAGDGPASQGDKYAPVAVAGGRAYTSITAASSHTCALDTAGKAWCWGADTNGLLGDGPASQANKYAPVAVASGRAYTAISAGYTQTCALDTALKAWCWGNPVGGFGNGSQGLVVKFAPVQAAGGRVWLLP